MDGLVVVLSRKVREKSVLEEIGMRPYLYVGLAS